MFHAAHKWVSNVLLSDPRISVTEYAMRSDLCTYTYGQARMCVQAGSLYTHKQTQQRGKWELVNHIIVTAIMTDDCIIFERKSLSPHLYLLRSDYSPSLSHCFLSDFLYWGQKVIFQRLWKEINEHWCILWNTESNLNVFLFLFVNSFFEIWRFINLSLIGGHGSTSTGDVWGKSVSCLCVNPFIFSLHQSNSGMQTFSVENRLLCWMSSALFVMCCLLTVLSIVESSQEAVHTPWQSTDSLSALHGCSEGSQWLPGHCCSQLRLARIT